MPRDKGKTRGTSGSPSGLTERTPRDLTATVDPSGLVLRATLVANRKSRRWPLSLGFGAFRVTPIARPVGLPEPTTRLHPVDLTAFPGGPTSGLRYCHSGCSERRESKGGPAPRQLAKTPGGHPSKQVK